MHEQTGYARYNAIHRYQMRFLDTKAKKLGYLFSTYFAISRNDCLELPLLPRALSFVYLLLKPLRVLRKLLSRGPGKG